MISDCRNDVQRVTGVVELVSVSQALAGLVHERAGGIDVGCDEDSLAFDDVTSDDHGLDIGWARIEHHGCDRVPE